MLLETKTLVGPLVLAGLWIAESWVPFYPHFPGRFQERLRHDARNVFLGAANAALLALLMGGALTLEESSGRKYAVGLLRVMDLPLWIETTVALIAFDLWMYIWHRTNHRIPFLWRFHRMHHSDREVDATTAVRFHTGEVFLSSCARLAVVPALGMDLWQLGLYELILLPVISLHHSNVRLPRLLDRGLLAVLVTPAMHRVHHSRKREETDSNYGSVLPYWDLILRTFRIRADARTIELGLDGFDGHHWQSLKGMLLTPLAPHRPQARENHEQSIADTEENHSTVAHGG